MAIQFTGLASGLDTQSIIQDLMDVEYTRVEEVQKDKQMIEWKKEAWEEMNTELYDFYRESIFDFRSASTYNKKKVTSSNTSIVSMNDSSNAVRGTHSISVTQMARGSFLTGKDLGDLTSTTTAADLATFTDPSDETEIKTITLSLDGGTTTHDIDIAATDSIAQIIDKFEALDLDMNIGYDDTYNRFFLSSTETGNGVQLQLSGDSDMLSGLGFDATVDQNGATAGIIDGTAGVDAIFDYNGTTGLTSSGNDVTINGLSFDITGEGGSSTISVAQDTDAIYESVKNFVLKYNELMMNINEKIGADSASDYEPLTADEKAAMTEDDVTLWESKIKDSLLRRDDTLTSIGRSLRNTMTLSSGVNTTDFAFKSLSTLGIVTGGYEEQGLLHIEGDEDESLYGLKDNRLREAIEDDPDGVAELMTALGEQLYSSFQERMKSTTLSSALTFYNDKFMDTQVSGYEDRIFDLEDRMSDIEERYYRQFTAMEQAIQQSNSTGDWLSQQLASLG